MKILHAASEFFPLIKTGGLADVLGALPYAQQQQGDDVRAVLPYYPKVQETMPRENTEITAVLNTFAGSVTIRYADCRGLGLYLIDAPQCFDRPGSPYHDENYHDYPDNVFRFGLLGWTAAVIANGEDKWWGRADVLHTHDWQAGLAPAYLAHWNVRDITTAFTIHNIAYQGCFNPRHLPELWLPGGMCSVEGMEFYGQISFLKSGLYYSDQITAVSPTYADEITRQPASNGMEGLLSTRAAQGRLHGILNGVDADIWNPETDPHIAKNYSLRSIQHKTANKTAIQQQFGLNSKSKKPLLTIITRLAEQKGADILARAIQNTAEAGELPYQFILLGSGEPDLENWYRWLAAQYPADIAAYIGYSEPLSHQLIAGADAILIPSRFEPCGLTQLYGLKYGTLPIVRRTGGLADTVVNADDANQKNKTATGFTFDDPTPEALQGALTHMLQLWKKTNQWHAVMGTAMRQDFSWQRAAAGYRAIYTL